MATLQDTWIRLCLHHHPDLKASMHNLLVTQEDSPDLEVDADLMTELLAGVRKFPEGVPI